MTDLEAPPSRPELRPFDRDAPTPSWRTEQPPTWVKDYGSFKATTSADAVYRFYDRHRQLLYIGMTSSMPSSRWAAHRKTASWWSQAAYVSIQWVTGGNAAAVEKAAIQAEHPPYNKQHTQSRSSFMVFTKDGPAAIVEQFRLLLLPDDFKALVAAFTAEGA